MARDLFPPPLARLSKRWRSRTHSACEKLVRFLIPINTDHLFIVTLLISKPKCEPSRHSVAYYCCILLPNVLGIRTPRGQAVVCANCLSFRRDLPASLPYAMYFLPNCEKPLDVDYQVWIIGVRILTNAQVIGLQASLTAHFEYILNLTQQ